MAKSLPFDIIHRIIVQAYNKHLWPIDFYNLCLVSQSFYNIAAPLLWSDPQLNSLYDLYKFLQAFYLIFSSNTESQYIKQDIIKIKKLDLGFISSYNEEFQNQYKSFSFSASNNYTKINNPYLDNINEPDNYYSSRRFPSKRIPYTSELPPKYKNDFNTYSHFNSSSSFNSSDTNVNLPFLLKFLFEKISGQLQSLIIIGNPSQNIIQITKDIASKNHKAFSNLNSLILLNIKSTSVNKLKMILQNCNKLNHLSIRVNSPQFTNVASEIKELENVLKALPNPELINFLRLDTSYPQDSLIETIIPNFKNLETLQLNGNITNKSFINLFKLQNSNKIKEINELTIYCKDMDEDSIPIEDIINDMENDNNNNNNTNNNISNENINDNNNSNNSLTSQESNNFKNKEFNIKSISYRHCHPYQIDFLLRHCYSSLQILNVYIDSFYKLNLLNKNINQLETLKELYLAYEFSEPGNLQLVYYMYHNSLEVLSIDSSYIRNLEWPFKRQRKYYRNLMFDYDEYKRYEEKYYNEPESLDIGISSEDFESKIDFLVPLKKSKLKTFQCSRCSFDALNTTEIFQICENLEELSFFRVNFLFVIPFDDLVTYFPQNVKKLTIINCGHYTSLILKHYLSLKQLEAIHIDISDVSTDLLMELTKLNNLYSIEIAESFFQNSNLHKYSLCFETMMKVFAEKAEKIIENRKLMINDYSIEDNKSSPKIFKQIKIDFPIYMDYSLNAVRALLKIPDVQCIDIKIEGMSFQPWKSVTKFQSPTCLYQPLNKKQLNFINQRSSYTNNTVWVKKVIS
ncbi:hypothetical protein BCR32DRAFT_289523 [Anaeromyces robustus]|uniref:F-box domain-containing protein n=1 Tax=Anaeromyces robustus TaxID=1754192 RepID=A0A1Y1XN79_9FUNG|nr:hypothetical protein BCR32DRAFT_289523 [Anaeromyces robustus]|eukprot:ORX87125.1 hypothetical protein BCR32DRAFT_289523 [Anaeromyces robustus]